MGDEITEFIKWLPEDKRKEFEQLMNQFRVKSFAEMKEQSTSDKLSGEQMEKKPEFTGNPKKE